MKTGGSISGKKGGKDDLNKTFNMKLKPNELDVFEEYSMDLVTGNSTQIHLKRLYR